MGQKRRSTLRARPLVAQSPRVALRERESPPRSLSATRGPASGAQEQRTGPEGAFGVWLQGRLGMDGMLDTNRGTWSMGLQGDMWPCRH